MLSITGKKRKESHPGTHHPRNYWHPKGCNWDWRKSKSINVLFNWSLQQTKDMDIFTPFLVSFSFISFFLITVKSRKGKLKSTRKVWSAVVKKLSELHFIWDGAETKRERDDTPMDLLLFSCQTTAPSAGGGSYVPRSPPFPGVSLIVMAFHHIFLRL